MKKARHVNIAFFLTVCTIFSLYGQQDNSTLTLPPSYHLRSTYVVTAFPEIPVPLSLMKDTLDQPLYLLDVSYGERILDVAIDSSWSYISFTEYIDDEVLRIPFTSTVEWYFNHMIQVKRVLNFIDSFNNQDQGSQRYTCLLYTSPSPRD